MLEEGGKGTAASLALLYGGVGWQEVPRSGPHLYCGDILICSHVCFPGLKKCTETLLI